MMDRIWGLPEGALQTAVVTPIVNNVTTTANKTTPASSPTSVTQVTQTPAVTSTATSQSLLDDDEISLSVGIGIGVPSLLAAVVGIFIGLRHH